MKKAWYAVLTADVLYSKELTSRQKLLVAVIGNMANDRGYCYAGNAHFAEMLDCSVSSIKRDISKLEEMNFIVRKIQYKDNGEVECRALTPVSRMNPPRFMDEPTPRFMDEPYNNKDLNNKVNTTHTKGESEILNLDGSGNNQSKSPPRFPAAPPQASRPESVHEVIEWAVPYGITSDIVEHWYDHREAQGWVKGHNEIPIKNWQADLKLWAREERSRNKGKRTSDSDMQAIMAWGTQTPKQ